MSSMFNLSFNLNKLDLSSFDIENVTKMEAFIAGGGSLNILNPFYLGGKIQIDNKAVSNKIKVNKKSFEKFSKFIDKESLYFE